MGRMRLARLWPLVYCLQAHQSHQAADTVATGFDAIPRQADRDLATAEERILCEQLVDRFHQRQCLFARRQRPVVER